MKDIKPLFQRALPHLGVIALFFLINLAFFYPQLEGLDTAQHDILESYGKNIEVVEHYRATGEKKLWSNNIFAGMPSFYNGLRFDNNLTLVENPLMLFFGRPIGFFMVYMLVTYFSLLIIGLRPLESAIGAIGFGFATNNIILYDAGHLFKNGSLMYSPFIIAGVISMIRKKFLAGMIIYALGLALAIKWHHVQMTYYLYICLLILGVIYLVKFVRSKEYSVLGKVLLYTLIGTSLGVAANTARLWTTYDYSEETMRGKPILEESAGQMSSSSTQDGLDWDYAMGWSNNTLDVLTGIVPGMVGGSSGERMSSGATYDALINAGQRPEVDGTFSLPMYWGALPFTSGPIYFGAIFVFLFVLALFLVKGRIKWWLAISTLVTILISYGKNMELFNWLLFEYFPMFNRFRTPNSVLSITSMLIPMLGAMGLYAWFNNKDHAARLKALYYSAGITGGLCLFIALLGPGMFSFEGQNDAQLQGSPLYELIVEDRKSMMSGDAFRSLMFILLAGGLLWLHQLGKIKAIYVLSGILLLVIIDLWGVNRRYLKAEDFTTNREALVDQYYQEREVDRQIKEMEESRGDYRVHDLSINTFNSNRTSYHHNTIGGYSAVKMQRIQDMIDLHISRMNMDVLNMLNARYIIDQNEQLQINREALGWVWLVSDIHRVNSPREEIDALNDFNPAQTAVVLADEFGGYLDGLQPTGEGRIERVVYDLDYWKYEYNTDSEQLAVFSEIWYKPEKGMRAFVNGEEVDFIRANYCLRAIRVPAGTGVIEFSYEPRSFIVGDVITQLSSMLLVLLLLGWLGYSFYQNKERLMAPVEPTSPPQKTKPAKKTTRKRKNR